jgi:hypothetical protein
VPVNQDREERAAAAWATSDDHPEERAAGFRAVIGALVAELPEGSALGPFERACAFDSTGHSDRAVPRYREAPARGPDRHRERRAKIQLSGSLRSTGQPEEGVKLLTPNRTRRRTSRTMRCGPRSPCAGRVSAATARRCPWCWARSPPICRDRRSMANHARAPVDPGA